MNVPHTQVPPGLCLSLVFVVICKMALTEVLRQYYWSYFCSHGAYFWMNMCGGVNRCPTVYFHVGSVNWVIVHAHGLTCCFRGQRGTTLLLIIYCSYFTFFLVYFDLPLSLWLYFPVSLSVSHPPPLALPQAVDLSPALFSLDHMARQFALAPLIQNRCHSDPVK